MIILKSDSGNHPAHKWAFGTASIIFNIEDVGEDRMLAAQSAQVKIAETLQPHYEAVINEEANSLDANPGHITTEHDAFARAEMALNQIHSFANETLWSNVLRGEEWSKIAFDTIKAHLQTAQHTERLLFADRNPNLSVAQAYKAKFNN